MADRQDLKFRQHHDDDTGEHTVADAGQLTLFILFMAVWISDVFFIKYSILLNNYIPTAVKMPIGIVVLIVAGYMVWDGMRKVFGPKGKKPHVINRGVFSVIRHPIYVSEILLYLGLILLNTSIAAIGVWIIAIVFLHYISRYEERLLLERFGEEYRQYMKDVPMYFPGIFRKKTKS